MQNLRRVRTTSDFDRRICGNFRIEWSRKVRDFAVRKNKASTVYNIRPNHTWLSPNSITPTFTQTSLRGKSWTQITKVADTNHVALMRISFVTMHGENRRQSQRQVPDKVADLSRTQIMKVGDVICVANFYDLCPWQVRDFVANLSGLCRKVIVMEFGL